MLVETLLVENPLSIQEIKDWLFITAINKELKVHDRDLLHFCGEKNVSEFSLPLQRRKCQGTLVANKVLRLPYIYEQQTGSHVGLDQHWLKPSLQFEGRPTSLHQPAPNLRILKVVYFFTKEF